MSDDRRPEETFFSGDRPPAAGPPAPARRRESALLRRSPALAVGVLAVSGWLLAGLWPDVAYFFSSQAPIDLGGPGTYRLDAARENRLVQVRGPLSIQVPVTESRTGAQRTVGLVAGTTLLVDRPGARGPDVYEGRLLPAAARGEYGPAAAIVKARRPELGDRWLVLRDGERPRRGWVPVLGAALLLALAAVNLRALARHLLPAPPSRPTP